MHNSQHPTTHTKQRYEADSQAESASDCERSYAAIWPAVRASPPRPSNGGLHCVAECDGCDGCVLRRRIGTKHPDVARACSHHQQLRRVFPRFRKRHEPVDRGHAEGFLVGSIVAASKPQPTTVLVAAHQTPAVGSDPEPYNPDTAKSVSGARGFAALLVRLQAVNIGARHVHRMGPETPVAGDSSVLYSPILASKGRKGDRRARVWVHPPTAAFLLLVVLCGLAAGLKKPCWAGVGAVAGASGLVVRAWAEARSDLWFNQVPGPSCKGVCVYCWNRI